MDETNNDLYPVQLKDPEVPIQEDCTSDVVPEGTTNMEGKKKVLVPELITMTKYLFDNYRLSMYSYLNRCLRSGELSRIVGFSPLNRVFNKDSVSFSHVSYWKIDRENFFADVQVELKLETPGGHLEWHGYLVFWCEFGASFTCSIEDLTDTVEREGEYDLLSPFLVPYYSNKRMDEVAEQIWLQYIPEALTDPTKRIASELAKRMGLTIQYHPVYEHRGVDSILFFAEDDLVRGTDRMEKGDNGKKERIKDNKGYIIHIPANTIVVNTNLIHRDYSAYNIFHECVHYDQHYMFFRLQAMGSNDPRKVKVREVIVDKDQEVTDPIYFMEKQANRGAYGLMLPVTDTKKVITSEYEKVENYRHIGERYEIAGKAISRQQCIPHFRIRARMIQLGFVQAKGALNYVERKLIQPFAFNLDAWREEQHTFVVDRWTTNALYRKNEEFQAVMDSGKYVYADGHVVRNDPRFVEKKGEDFFLTEWASAHVDDCCLRFVRQYVQQNVGRYVFGRMYYDADYVQQTQFYLNDLINREHLDELDAKTLYIQKFPKDFKGAIEQLKKQNKTSNAKMAEFLNMDDSTFARSLDDPKKYMNEDYLTVLCLYFKLPDWISRMVFKRAHFQMDEEDKRHQALLHILRVQSNDSVEAANEYLKKNHLAPLSF